MAHGVSDIRTFTLIGHGDSGKTALVDAMAFLAKITPRHGQTADGSSVSDSEPEEKDKKHTLSSHLFHLTWKNRFCQFIDTPGHPDFLADTISSLYAVETAVIHVSAAAGLTFHGRRLAGEAEKAGVARAIVVTRCDLENTDFEKLLASLVGVFGDRVVPMTYPDATGPDFKKVHSVLGQDKGPAAARFRSSLEERIAEVDDKLMEHYFEAGTLTDAELAEHLPRAMVAGKLIPLFAVHGPRELGVSEFLDTVAAYFPTPAHAAPRKGKDFGDKEVLVPGTDDGPLCGFVFKVVVDPFVGRLSYLRVLRGTVTEEQHAVWIARLKKAEKSGGIFLVQGKDASHHLPKASAGEIVAFSKVEALGYCDTVCAESSPVVLPRIELPRPMVSQAIEPENQKDEAKIGGAVEKMHAEDPTFVVSRDPDTHEVVASGMSNMHLDIIYHKIRRRYNVGIKHHPPRIPYRETIAGKADGHHRHKKQSGGRGQFGEVYLRIFPKERGSGFEFVDSVVGGSIPRQFIPEIEKGIRQILVKGVIAGYPVVDVAAEVYDGKFHDVDSDQISFQIAGRGAFADAFEKSRPVLLEPIMALEIVVPTRFTGDITGNLNSKRGRLSGMDALGEDMQVIKAMVPLKEVQDYSTQLRSVTAGEGTFTMGFSHYDPLPPHLTAEIVAQYRKHREAEKAE